MLRHYVLKSISQMFFPFFFVLFFISVIISLITIATITNNIKMDLLSLLTLLYYSLPGSLFFVVSITFVAACILGLSRLSYDSEMLVFFSLGIGAKRIVYIILPICLLATAVLFMFSFIMTPLSKNAYRDFLVQKSTSVNINIKPGDTGQSLGDWLVYVDSKNDSKYNGLVLYSNKEAGKQSFIIANSGEALNKNAVFELELQNGEAYFNENKKAQKIGFEQMNIRSPIATGSLSSYDLVSYWVKAFKGDSSQARRFSQGFVTSLFPIASLFLIPFFGIRNPRFHKNRSYLYVLGSTIVYFLLMYGLSMELPFVGLALPFVWFFAGLFLYIKYIRKVY
ncbi:LptF/LptG family permease [Helicobacter sp. 11S02629-2]|uniref:LptF/LptG family permease n=1 Tax=Helicobacter sp. 11S02629-2 TaxID=1476195 RepID=UPI000BA5B61D|nr:LptF/LptG family permease [Helicobacter sp. 11S02629-2]PAF45688.1 hypothetical protein BKH40_02065 [Helicobacter sp. 11S02629-2]